MSTPQAVHPYLRDGWDQNKKPFEPRTAPIVPDVNPADTVVQRMRAKLIGAAGGGAVLRGLDGTSGQAGGAGGSGGNGSNGSGGGFTIGHGGGPTSGGAGAAAATATTDIATLEETVASLSTQITGASISAECNGDGTITVTLTWGS
jgi:hypothetical protein